MAYWLTVDLNGNWLAGIYFNRGSGIVAYPLVTVSVPE